MKKIELINMKIRNFRGFKEFEFKVDGQNLTVSGENGTRKTTLFDAFMQAIFGKNSQYLSDFKFMPLDEHNDSIEHLETEVILELSVSGDLITFSRMAKVGAGKVKGYTSTYRVDGVNMLQKDYNKKIAEIIDEETLRSQHLAKQNEKIDDLQVTKQNLFEKAMDAQNTFLAKEGEAKGNPKEKELKESESAIKVKQEEITATEKTISDLRESYMVIASEVFLEFDEHATSCQYCGHDYQEDKKEEIKKNYE